MEIKSVGIVGHGAFGAYIAALVHRFAPDITVKIYSRRFEPDGKQFFSIEEVGQCDAVVLCARIAKYEEELATLLPYLAPHTVLVDVATVKRYTSQLLAKLAPTQSYLCTHPMFGPESDKKTGGDVTGFRIVMTEKTIPEEDYNRLCDFLTTCGFVVVEMTSDEHDQLLANTLFMTHYIGQTVTAAGFERTSIDSVSFQSLMNAVESVAGDEELFKDVYQFNPYCKAAADRFHAAQEKVWSNLPS